MSHAKKPPLITFETVNEALSLILTEYNITPKPSLGGATPLALFEHHCTNHFVRYVPRYLSEQWKPLLGETKVRLHWYTHENRMPHINFLHARYQGTGLLPVAGKEKWIRVKFNREDIRCLEAYTLHGESLGTLQVMGAWRRYPHSVTTRNRLHKHAKDYRLDRQDILGAYVHYLLKNKTKAGAALSLLRIVTEFTSGMGGPLYLSDNRPSRLDHDEPSHYAWHTSMAYQGD